VFRVVQELLRRRADVRALDGAGLTALHVAVMHHRVDTTRALLDEAGVHPDQR
jgi:ankyrin repeat protein